jgi:hypothetical protein
VPIPSWLKNVGSIGLKIAAAIIPGVAAIEEIARTLPGLHGKAKQDAVVVLVRSALLAAESITEKDLLNDPDVEQATRGVIDAVVALDNLIEAKRAART